MSEIKKEDKKESTAVKTFKDRFTNLKNIRKNFNAVRNNPYAFNKFQYYIIRAVIVLVAVIVAWQLIQLFFSYSAGVNTPMVIMVRGILLIIMVIFGVKLYNLTKFYKKTLLHYEENPSTIDNHFNESKLDLNTEIDSILNKYDDKGQLKGGDNIIK